MESQPDDCLVCIFAQLSFAQRVRLESVCRRWMRILRSHAPHSNMQSLNLADYIRENRSAHYFEQQSPLLEQTMCAVLDRAGPFIRELDFGSRWPTIPQEIVQKISEKCVQLTRLDMGWVRMQADISVLLDKVAEQLVEFSLEETSWEEPGHAAKVPKFFPRMKALRRLNVRKFGQPIDELAQMDSGTLEHLDVSEASQLNADTLIQLLARNPQLLSLTLCPMPRQCLPLVAGSTSSAINRPGPFLGFIRPKAKQPTGRWRGDQLLLEQEQPLQRPKKDADLQALIDRLGRMKRMRTLWLGHISYTTHFLSLAPLGEMEELRNLHLKECSALDGNALKTILTGLREHLRQLSLLGCAQLDDFSALALCSTLIHLDVEKAKCLNDEAMQGLAKHGRLRIMRAKDCPRLTDEAIWTLVDKCPLKDLELNHCSGISAQLFSNKHSFSNCKTVERLSLSGSEAIQRESILEAVEVFQWDCLQQLDLSKNMNLDDSILGPIKEKMESERAKRGAKNLTICCTGTGITKRLAPELEPLVELAFY